MTNDQYREQWLIWRKQYDIIAFIIFRKAIKQSISGLNIDNITYANYTLVVPLNIIPQPIQQAYNEVYRKIGLTHGRRVGFGINRELKRFNNDLFNRFFQNNIIEWIRNHAGKKIVSVTDTISKRIIRLIEVAQEQGLSVLEMQKYLTKKINSPDFTKYQALRIAVTETTTAANHGATIAADNSGIMLEKFWISTKDGKTRRIPKDQFDHVHMDGVAVGQFDKFNVVSKLGVVDHLDYPGDPAGSAGDVISCRCTVAYRPIRDANGFVISR